MSELTTDEKFGLILESLGKIDATLDELKADRVRQDQIIENQNVILGKLESIVGALSSRSIRQEADIKDLINDQLKLEAKFETTVQALATRSIEQENEINKLKADKDKEAS